MLATREWLPSDRPAAAPLAVLVHGVAGWHRTWWRVGPALADAGWRVVAIDQRGHGHSPRIEARVTVRDLAADLATVIETFGGRSDLLIGHSLGGAVALELAIARPQLVGRLVLEDPPAITRTNDEAWLAQMERALAAAAENPMGEVAIALKRSPSWLGEDARQDVDGKRLADGAGLIASFRADIGSRVLDLLPRLEVPTLLLLADPGESAFPQAARDHLATTPPAMTRVLELASGHCIHRDRFDDYMAVLDDWLAQVPNSEPGAR